MGKVRELTRKLRRGGKRQTEREKVEERREEVLANGRKFKYPLQYAKSTLVIITTVIIVVAMGLFAGLSWFSLYKLQTENDIMYRLTGILPVPVAKIDGRGVRFSDYLLIYRSTITPVEQQGQMGGTVGDLEAMRSHYKRAALTEAENYAYAMGLAGEMGLSVSEEEIDAAVTEQRKVGGVERSMEAFTKILADNFGLNMTEYRRMVYLNLVKQKVAREMDTRADEIAARVEASLAEGKKLAEIAGELGDEVMYEETGGLVDKMNVDGGRALKAMSQEVGQVSERMFASSGEGYYFVETLEKGEKGVSYASILVPLTVFEEKVAILRGEGKVREYIEIEE